MATKQKGMSEGAATTALMSFQFILPREDDPMVYESKDLLEQARKVTIKSDKGNITVTDRLVRVKAMIKDAEDKQKAILKPIKETLVNPINKFFKDILDPLKDAEKMFKRAIGEWAMKKEEDARELADILKDNGDSGAMTVPDPVLNMEREGGRTVVSSTWEFEIVDITKVEVKYLRQAVETARGREGLEQVIRATVASGVRSIPGVNIHEEKRVAVTLK